MGRRLRTRWSPRTARAFTALLLAGLGALLLPGPAPGAAVSASSQGLAAFALPASQLAATPSGLLRGADGNFYGTTFYGGANDLGSVFKLTPTGTLTTLYSFTGQTDGTSPAPSAGLIQDGDGNVYGTTYKGGPDDHGTIFKLTPTGTLTTLHAFTVAGADGQYPLGGLVRDASTGTLYGTTSEGGGPGYGTVFKLDATNTLTTLHLFSGPEGHNPFAGLVRDSSTGTLYGTTYGGGAADLGTVFQLMPTGETFSLTTLHEFSGADGANPQGLLLRDPTGTLYGTTFGTCTYGGGACSGTYGTVFQLVPAGETFTFTALHSFTETDGANPSAGLVQDPAGTLYGTTFAGGPAHLGTLFQLTLTPTPSRTTLHSFTGPDGAIPQAGLTLGSDGYFYGTTAQGGGTGQRGVAFVLRVGNLLTLTPAGTGTGTVTSAPAGLTCPGTCTEVFLPTATVTLTPAADPSSTFTGWSGDCTEAGPCVLGLGVPRAVTATFTLKTFALTIHKGGTGTGTVTSAPAGLTCGTTCSVNFDYGTLVTLTATATSPAVFTGWSGGGCSGTGTCVVTLTQAQTVTATFDPPLTPLTVQVAGSSLGSVTSSPPGIPACAGSCTASFPTNTAVTLTVAPGAGGTFTGWRGACTGAGACVVPLTAAQTVTAVFAKTFTDPSLTAGSTPIKVVHLTDLRAAIDALRIHVSLPAFPWTDPTLAPGSSVVKRQHLLDLRTALEAAYTATPGKTHAAYTDPAPLAGTTPIKASHLSELRSYVRGLE